MPGNAAEAGPDDGITVISPFEHEPASILKR
jgi:hypothetical protein